LQYLLT